MIATKQIVLMRPYVTDEMRSAVQQVLLSRYVGQGPRVDEFELEFSRRVVSGRSTVAVNSCTSALNLAYLLAGIGPNCNVIAPLFTCTATNEALLYDRLKPEIRFCDVAPGSLNMSPEHAAKLIDEKTKAIVVVHYGGAPVDDKLFHLGIPVIEDCAQALGPGWPGMRGAYAAFSFQAVKTLTTADGGMLILPEYQVARAKRLRWFGIDRVAKLAGVWANDITEVGYKFQMTDMSASMGLAGLEHLAAQTRRRHELRDTYQRGLNGIDGIRLLDTDPESACWLCTVLVDRREDLKRKLAGEGIESDPVHYRNDRYSIFKEFRGEFPNMDAIEGKYLCIPLHMGMGTDDVGRICDVIRSGW